MNYSFLGNETLGRLDLYIMCTVGGEIKFPQWNSAMDSILEYNSRVEQRKSFSRAHVSPPYSPLIELLLQMYEMSWKLVLPPTIHGGENCCKKNGGRLHELW